MKAFPFTAMFLITFRARIKPNSEAAKEFSNIGGAYINCWIYFKCYDAAEKLAKLLIRESGWIPEKKIEGSVIQKKELKTKEDKKFYAGAVKYGYILVFHTWPKDAVDADIDDE